MISLRELIELAAIDASEHELASAFHGSKLSSKFSLESGYVLEKPPADEGAPRPAVEEEARRRERARVNLRSANRFGTALKKGTILVSVSGANSFLSAGEDEDIDFFCVTKTNGLWSFMLKALILARIHRMGNSQVPELCFSVVMDEKWAAEAFSRRQPAIFARDALTAKVIGGTSAYHSLLEGASWMEEYFPAFYRMRLRETSSQKGQPPPERARAGEGSVVLNVFLYHTLGRFLRMKSWTLNRKLTKSGWHSAVFATRVGAGHFIYESNRYRDLRRMYGSLEKDG